jgi:hypothetical protein
LEGKSPKKPYILWILIMEVSGNMNRIIYMETSGLEDLKGVQVLHYPEKPPFWKNTS